MKPVSQKREIIVQHCPPKVPCELAQLDRAIMLLGSHARAGLTHKLQAELRLLIGWVPDRDLASVWKSKLKVHRKIFYAPPAG